MTRLAGAHVLITGGSQGIGLATARAAAHAGASVSIIARDSARLAEASAGIPGARWRGADVRDAAALARAIGELEAEAGPVDILICCAGTALPGRFLDVHFDEFRAQMDLNYLGTVAALRCVLPGMVERGHGHVVVTSSTAGLLGVVGYTGYGPTKWAVRGLAETLRYEVSPRGVHVAVLYPPDTDTPGFAAENTRKPPETVAVSGAIKPVAAEVVAKQLLRGIERNRENIAVDALTKVLVRWGPLLEPLIRPSLKKTIAKAVAAQESRPTAADGLAADSTPTSVHSGAPLGVSPGVAYGPVFRMSDPVREPAAGVPLPPEARPAAVERLVAVMAAVTADLEERASRLQGEAQEIVSATAMMASDPGVRDDASRLVTESGESPERAVWVTLGVVAAQFAEMGGRAAERSTDILDVRGRLVAHLAGRPLPGIPEREEPFVLVARDLAPADTAELNPELCKAIITVEGGPTSHTAILARSLGIPAVVGARDAFDIPEGTVVLVDGTTGAITLNPSAAGIAAIEAAPAEGAHFSGHGQTSDGHPVELLANIGSPAGVGAAVDAGAEGVGLFRTEFCFLDRTVAPTIDEQVDEYRAVFAAFPGKKVVVRTLDAGADKPLAFVSADHEDNPALGIRGIRTSWRRGDLLDDQLAAIARAAAAESAHVQVMAPMIATLHEAREFARACSAHGIAIAGAMIETPAAALMAAGILAEVEFASLGTNDLAQYTMAADRLVGELAELNDPWQPAVLRLVATACTGGVTAGKPVGVCGEAAADPLLAVVLVGLGVSSLSMTAKAIVRVAVQLAAVTHESCVDAARLAVSANSPAEGRAAVVALLAGL